MLLSLTAKTLYLMIALTTIDLAVTTMRLLEGRAAPPRVVTITATDFALDAPSAVSAGSVTLRLRNNGLMPHHARLVRLEGERSLRDLERELVAHGRLPEWALDVGGPGTVAPARTSEITLDVTPGPHVLLCAERLRDGTLAVMKGMYLPLEVVPGRGSGADPRTDATLTLLDGKPPLLAGRLRAGRQRIRVLNVGSAALDIRLYRLHAARAEADLRAWVRGDGSAPPADAVGGVVGLPSDASAVLTLQLPRGEYLMQVQPAHMRGGADRSPEAAWRRIRID